MFIFDGPQMMILLILSKMLTIIMHLSSGYMLERIRNILNLMVKLQISELTLAKILSDLAKTSLNQMIFLLSIQDWKEFLDYLILMLILSTEQSIHHLTKNFPFMRIQLTQLQLRILQNMVTDFGSDSWLHIQLDYFKEKMPPGTLLQDLPQMNHMMI